MSDQTSKNLSIKHWAEDDRPREKLLLKGRQALTDSELMAILIGSGHKEKTAVELSQEILAFTSNNLNELAKLSVTDLMKFKGIGEAKAITIVACLELGRRRKQTDVLKRKQVKSSKDIFEELQPYLIDLHHEEFWMVLLNRKNEILSTKKISSGGVSGTIADAKLIFKAAIEGNATHIVVSHNHPSGNLKPSQSDISLTQNLIKAGKVMDISVLDHIIIAGNSYFSFADEGLMT